MTQQYISKYLRNPENKIAITDERFCFEQPITFILNENFFSISDDDFTIKDLNGVKYFQCLGKTLSIRDKKVLYDMYNQPILNIQDKLLSLRGKMNIYEGKTQEKSILRIKPKSPIFNQKFTVTFLNKVTGKNELFEMDCDFMGFNCEIYYGKKKNGAPMICRIIKKVDTKAIFTSDENYYVEVAAGVDTAAMIALAICFDEGKNEDSGPGGCLCGILDIFTFF